MTDFRTLLFLAATLTGCATAPANKAEAPKGNTPAPSQSATSQPIAVTPAQPEQPAATAAANTAKPTPTTASVSSTTSNAPVAAPVASVATAPQPLPATTSPLLQDEGSQIDVWQRIRNGFAMPDADNKTVSRFEHWYAARPDYVERMTDRARRYLHFIVEEVDKRHMPMEIALLPMIESAFNPGAYSSARASGIWQFIPSTGKNFGMQQNWWYDGRRDVISATRGALDYLQKLHNMFGSWDLALAAYNAGENSVMRAQARNRKQKKPTNYASLRLPRETRQYVPKLMAVKNIVANPEKFGLVLTEIPNRPYFSEINTAKHIDVDLAAEMAGISQEEFAALNPAHSRPVILNKEDEVILLPVESVSTFRDNLEKATQPLVSWQACPTKKGDDLEEIADKYGITLEKLRSVNGIHRTIKTSNGQTLLVPLNGEQPETEFTAFNTNLPPTDNSLLNAIRHIVRRGDTLSGIARRYHVKLTSLKNWNKGVRILRPGQHILVAQPVAGQNTGKSTRAVRRTSGHRATPAGTSQS